MTQPILTCKPLKTILALGAHADDIEIGCGGTLLRLLSEQPGISVHWVVFSGTPQRAQEATDSAQQFLRNAEGRHVKLHTFRDSFFPYEEREVKEAFNALAKTISPDLIFTHRRDDAHQDHRTLANLTWCAFRNQQILEYEIPKYEGDLGQPNFYVRLSEETARRKVDITVEAFASQHDKPWFSRDTFQALMRIRGLECNAPSKLAEAFYCRKIAV